MKSEANLSFKQVKPRPNNIDLDGIKYIRLLFWIEFLKQISPDTLIINVDESSINRHIKVNYSWSVKGIPFEAQNSPYSGSTSIWLGIWSNGSWIALLSNETLDANAFMIFVANTESWLKDNNYFNYSEVLLLMDNSSIHKTNEVQNRILEAKMKIMYIPWYTPQFAPIEQWFSLIKNKLRSFKSYKSLNLSLKENINTIFEAMKSLNSRMIKKLFLNLIKLLKLKNIN